MLDRLREDLRLHAGSYFLLALLFFGVGITPLPYVRSAPGSTYNALGKESGTELVSITKTAKYPLDKTSGEIRILTVSQWGGPYGTLSWFDAVRSLWDHAIYIIPTRFLFAENTDPNAVADESQIQFASAESSAIGAALHYLKLPVTEFTSIVYIDKASPNAEVLKVGDQLVSADGREIVSSDDFSEVMKGKKAGDKVSLEVLREGKKKSLTLSTYVREGETKVRIGVILLADYLPPMPIKFGLEGVGGPSAGLAFALTLVDKLDGQDLARSRVIGVTGEISSDGTVGAIGGIPQKLAAAARDGASLMLIPRANCPVSPELIPPEITLIPVETLAEAVDALKSRSASDYPSC